MSNPPPPPNPYGSPEIGLMNFELYWFRPAAIDLIQPTATQNTIQVTFANSQSITFAGMTTEAFNAMIGRFMGTTVTGLMNFEMYWFRPSAIYLIQPTGPTSIEVTFSYGQTISLAGVTTLDFVELVKQFVLTGTA